MALQSSGAISLNDVAGEFGGSTPHSLSEYYGVATGVPGSGTISLSDFYGTANAYTIEYLVVAGGGSGLGTGWPSILCAGGGAGSGASSEPAWKHNDHCLLKTSL